ncbi:DUF4232 domain-containing protein [Cryptosporangium sp. NPDC051539]|uniref:DUF4232 domain-containing protein n=1 Tax=Cryptosporangium sp. NPDC051539 TaxID=3363962 RepID=UPI00378FD113
MRNRSALLPLAVVLGIGVVLTAACSGEGAGTAPASAEAAPTTAAPTTAAPTATASGASAVTASVPVCTNGDVKVDVTLQPKTDDGNTERGLLALTNASDHACSVKGRAAVSLTNAADEVVTVPTRKVDQPGPAERIVLKPGVTAFEGLKWTPCDKGSATCAAGNGMRFNLQASTDGPAVTLSGFPAPEKSAITMASLQIGTLQASHQGAVAW